MRAHLAFLVAAAGMVTVLAGCSDLGDPVKPRAELSATALDFGTVIVSGSSTRSVTVSNTGGAPLSCNATVSCAPYQITAGGGSFSLGPGERRTVTVSFTPSDVGPFPCTLGLGPQCPPVSLRGTGTLQQPGPHCAASTSALTFGDHPVGSSTSNGFQVSSIGTDPVDVNIVSSCPDVIVTAGGGPAQLAPSTSITVTVEFHPTAGGTLSCTVAVGADCPDVSVTGDGTTVSYLHGVRPIFQAHGCLNPSCHGNPVDSGITGMLTSYGNFVNRASFGYRPALIVKPYDADHSVLYNKILGNPAFGQQMPQNGPPFLTQAQIDLIQTWILEGAHNN